MCTLILIVKEASSTVATPLERPGPCSAIREGSAGGRTAPDEIAETKVCGGVTSGRRWGH